MGLYIPFRQKCVAIANTSEFLALPVFAKKHNISERTVSYWLRTRKVSGYKSGGRWYIRLIRSGL
jgi:hypothetical protein